ncbi:MAG: HlyD family efflux transporter periplasmic adaptor subunit [Planctomycetota bacterium]
MATFFFTKIFFTVWLCGLIAAISIVISHWSEFTSELGSALVFSNLPIMLGVTAGLKLWHELGHGYACRHYGVSVPSAGILLMIGTPLAFMDATGSWSLNKKYQRQIINLAGMYFELMLTIIAAFVWVLVDDSFVRSICNFTMLISSITTIACNVNPLMKYDGYFVMADALGIPNLKARASFAIQGFYKYVFFRLPMPPCESRTLRVILLTYGFCAGLYKISLSIGIAAMIAMQVWLVGLAIGVYYTVTSLGTMVLQLGKYLIWSTEIQNQRKLAITYLLILALVIPAAILCVPIPGRAQARGVVEPRPLTVIHANNAGFVKELLVKAGDQIEKGRMITKFENLDRDRERQLKQAELKGLLVKYRRYRNEDRVQAAKAEKEIEQTQFELSSLRSLNPNDLIESPLPGTIITRLPPLQIGQYVSPGEEIVRIGGDGRVVKAVVNASSIATIQPKLGQTVHCRFLAQSESVIDGTIRSISASGNKVVPYEALTHLAGGFIPVSGESMEATEPFFEMEIELSESVPQEILKNGMVCDIRFGENYETVGSHVYRSLLRFHNQIRMSY